jgi:hypothetical protein
MTVDDDDDGSVIPMSKRLKDFVKSRGWLVVAAALCVYCSLPGDELADSHYITFINGAQVGPVQLTATAEGLVMPIGGPTPFDAVSNASISSIPDMNLTATNTGSTFNVTVAHRASRSNVAVATLTETGAKLDAVRIDPMTNPTVLVIRDRTEGVDVYVTAPGASIASVSPDHTFSTGGVIQILPTGVLHAGTQFQVRFTTAGTKTVIGDSGTLDARNQGEFVLVGQFHEGGSPAMKSYWWQVP